MKNYTITVNGNVYDVTVEEGASSVNAGTLTAPVQAKQMPKADAVQESKPVSQGKEGSIKINAPMPGKIVAVKAREGENIRKGQVIIVLEAMKMENDIVAPEDGVVASISVAVGSAVEAGETIATLN